MTRKLNGQMRYVLVQHIHLFFAFLFPFLLFFELWKTTCRSSYVFIVTVISGTSKWSQLAPNDCLEVVLSNRGLTTIPEDVLEMAPRIAVLDISANPDIQLGSSLNIFINLTSLSF